jgi:hypothetical protein
MYALHENFVAHVLNVVSERTGNCVFQRR